MILIFTYKDKYDRYRRVEIDDNDLLKKQKRWISYEPKFCQELLKHKIPYGFYESKDFLFGFNKYYTIYSRKGINDNNDDIYSDYFYKKRNNYITFTHHAYKDTAWCVMPKIHREYLLLLDCYLSQNQFEAKHNIIFYTKNLEHTIDVTTFINLTITDVHQQINSLVEWFKTFTLPKRVYSLFIWL